MTQPKNDIHDIIRHVINGMNNLLDFQEVIDNGDGTFTIMACNTLWVMENYVIEYNGEMFKVIDITPNVSITVEGDTVFDPIGPIPIDVPFYFHGTVRKTNVELIQRGKIGMDKYPMIYCFEIFREVFHQEKSDPNERTSALRLFFLGSADKENWLTEDHYEKVIIPLRNMVNEFIFFIDNRNNFGRLEDYTTINHVDFGTFTSDQGKLQNLFDDHLSGIELDISLVVKKGLICEGHCPDC